MSAATIDYDALAKQHGGAAAVDYDAMAAQHGGKEASAQAQTLNPDQEGMQPKPSAFYGDLKSMVTGAPEATARMLPGPQQIYQVKDAIADYHSIKTTGKTRAQLADDARKQAGYGAGYRAIAPVAENLGVNVSGMEQAAKEGDQAAVLGHAAAAATPLVAGELVKGVKATPEGAALSSKTAAAVKAVPEAAKGAVQAVANSKPVNFFADIANSRRTGQVVGGTAGAIFGKGVLSPAGAYYGAKVGGKLGVSIAENLGKLRDVLNKSASEVPNTATAAESTFEEAGAREPEVVHDQDPIIAAPAKVKAILDKAEADVKQVMAESKKAQPAAKDNPAPGSREDKLDDRAISQEMGWDVARQYYKGLADQRDMATSAVSSKKELTTGAKVDAILGKAAADARAVLEAAKIPSETPKAKIAGKIPASWVKDGKIAIPQPGDDLVELLQRSVDQAKARKGTVVKPPKGSVDGDGGTK
jgi:hypothetical protein